MMLKYCEAVNLERGKVVWRVWVFFDIQTRVLAHTKSKNLPTAACCPVTLSWSNLLLAVITHCLNYYLLSTVPSAVRPQQVAAVTGGSNSPSVVKQIQEQENKSTDSPTQISKPEQQQDDKEEEVKKEKKKVKKPKTPKVWLYTKSLLCTLCVLINLSLVGPLSAVTTHFCEIIQCNCN